MELWQVASAWQQPTRPVTLSPLLFDNASGMVRAYRWIGELMLYRNIFGKEQFGRLQNAA